MKGDEGGGRDRNINERNIDLLGIEPQLGHVL